MPTEEETYANVKRLKGLIAAHEAAEAAPPGQVEIAATMEFLGVQYDRRATFHYAYLSGGVKYREPGKEPYWTEIGHFLKLREEGKIVKIERHQNYDPVLGSGPSDVYGFK